MTFFKLSRYNGMHIDGHECANELVASRLMELLGIEHVPYRLIHATVLIGGQAHETWLNSSKNFRLPGERKLSLGAFFELRRENSESPLDFCVRMGWGEYAKRMFLIDYLMANRDRHSSNIEVLVVNDGSTRLAPLFDTGLSLVAPCAGDEQRVRAFDPLASVATTNFVGSRSLEENVTWAAPVQGIGTLHEADRETLLKGLEDCLPPAHREKIWEIIWTRWRRYAQI